MRRHEISLPWPPTVNSIWQPAAKHGRQRLSHEAKSYRVAVFAAVYKERILPFAGPVAITLVWHPPDNRRRDIDNPIKSVLDALQHAQVFADDRQVREMHVRFARDKPTPPGWVTCLIEQIELL